MTKKEMQMWENYKRSEHETIYDCYKTPSTAKVNAWKSLENVRLARGGANPRVPTHNTSTFSYAFTTVDDGGVIWLHYWTAFHDYHFPVEVEDPRL